MHFAPECDTKKKKLKKIKTVNSVVYCISSITQNVLFAIDRAC